MLKLFVKSNYLRNQCLDATDLTVVATKEQPQVYELLSVQPELSFDVVLHRPKAMLESRKGACMLRGGKDAHMQAERQSIGQKARKVERDREWGGERLVKHGVVWPSEIESKHCANKIINHKVPLDIFVFAEDVLEDVSRAK